MFSQGKKIPAALSHHMMGTSLTERPFFRLDIPDGYTNDSPVFPYDASHYTKRKGKCNSSFTFSVAVMIPVHGINVSWKNVPQSVPIVCKMKLQLGSASCISRHLQMCRKRKMSCRTQVDLDKTNIQHRYGESY